ncbi:hypothetical protein AB0D37_10010 [Streptomyces sp. NPDC048384]|uniref:hypothetical protein n=1 Tax=Streptomyces sp. NPDC048384 TaxID=3155487 RepID=UPI0034268473
MTTYSTRVARVGHGRTAPVPALVRVRLLDDDRGTGPGPAVVVRAHGQGRARRAVGHEETAGHQQRPVPGEGHGRAVHVVVRAARAPGQAGYDGPGPGAAAVVADGEDHTTLPVLRPRGGESAGVLRVDGELRLDGAVGRSGVQRAGRAVGERAVGGEALGSGRRLRLGAGQDG